jgi:hypothetical protein
VFWAFEDDCREVCFAAGTPRAMVATNDVVYGMLRAYAAYNDNMGQTVRIFRDMESAAAWSEAGDDLQWRGQDAAARRGEF